MNKKQTELMILNKLKHLFSQNQLESSREPKPKHKSLMNKKQTELLN